MDPRFKPIWKMAVESMGEDAPSETGKFLSHMISTPKQFLTSKLDCGTLRLLNMLERQFVSNYSNSQSISRCKIFFITLKLL